MDTPRLITVAVGDARLAGDLTSPDEARGVVLFAHGSGSGRFSPRNRFVAGALNRRGMATLLIDLLTAEEDEAEAAGGHRRFDIALLAGRLMAAVAWLRADPRCASLPIGLFGASTGAAAALVVAAREPEAIAAVVSRGGRPDLAGHALRGVRAPTLLIVGGDDREVLALNRWALDRLQCECAIEIVPGAGHLFAEDGALDRVAELASEWFAARLATTAMR
ncbi:MAG TPA: dienelactone hydrolase family protein [Planctomycetota bacterium]|nr:dienelactone hydrolase family protein [Planctomycetota bacterium]